MTVTEARHSPLQLFRFHFIKSSVCFRNGFPLRPATLKKGIVVILRTVEQQPAPHRVKQASDNHIHLTLPAVVGARDFPGLTPSFLFVRNLPHCEAATTTATSPTTTLTALLSIVRFQNLANERSQQHYFYALTSH